MSTKSNLEYVELSKVKTILLQLSLICNKNTYCNKEDIQYALQILDDLEVEYVEI